MGRQPGFGGGRGSSYSQQKTFESRQLSQLKEGLFMSKPAQQDSPEEIELFKAVARRIRQARLNIGLNHAELGEKLRVDKSYVFELERGTANPTLRTLHRVAKCLGIDPAELLPDSTRPSLPSAHVDVLVQLCQGLTTLLTERLGKELEAVQGLETALERLRPLEPQSSQGDAPEPVGESPRARGKPRRGGH